MAGYGKQREPIDLIIAKGKKHLTQAEIEERRNSEIDVSEYKNVKAPGYLSKKQKEEFEEISAKLVKIGIMSELDEDCLARYIIARSNYLKMKKKLGNALKDKKATIEYVEDCSKLEDRYFKQCNSCAEKLGLTITSRCRLQVPQGTPEKPKENKFTKFYVS